MTYRDPIPRQQIPHDSPSLLNAAGPPQARRDEALLGAGHETYRRFLEFQLLMRQRFNSNAVQGFMGAVIVLAFITNVINAEILPSEGAPVTIPPPASAPLLPLCPSP